MINFYTKIFVYNKGDTSEALWNLSAPQKKEGSVIISISGYYVVIFSSWENVNHKKKDIQWRN